MKTLILILFLFQTQARAELKINVQPRTGKSETPATSTQTTDENGPPLSTLFDEGGADCTKFIEKDGRYGEYGKILSTEFDHTDRIRKMLIDDDTKAVANDEHLKSFCPGIKPKDYKRFFIWTVTAVSWAESKCGHKKFKKPVACTNGNCVGLLQLEEDRDDRKWRGEHCDVSSVAKPEANLKCGLDILRGQFSGKYGSPPGIRKSYWEKLRGRDSGGEIKDRIASFPGCRPDDKVTKE